MKRTIYYRLEGDRKFFSSDIEKVIAYAVEKHSLSFSEKTELYQFGTTQNRIKAIGIVQFLSK